MKDGCTNEEITIFKNVSEDTLSKIRKITQYKSFHRGEIIFNETQQVKDIYYVKEGIIKASKYSSNGRKIVVNIKKSGDLFTLASLFLPNDSCYKATTTAITNTVVGCLPKEEFEEIILANPDLAKKVFKLMSMSLSRFSQMVADNTLCDVYGKTIKSLQRLGHEFGLFDESDHILSIDLPLSIQELANITGSTRETISRIMTGLKEDHLVSIKQKTIKINDWDKFCHLANQL